MCHTLTQTNSATISMETRRNRAQPYAHSDQTADGLAYVYIIWDYDTAIGQINASFPYNYHEERLTEEIENVERILQLGAEFEVPMTFACVGFAAEPGCFPFHVPDQLRRIHSAGHEIASHSWRHEWFPYLQREQIVRSLRRSKLALETCLGVPGVVTGFVPPFSRPMSWYARGAFSLGDRVHGPWYPGASYGTLLPLVRECGYDWCRVSHRPLWRRMTRHGRTWPPLDGGWSRHGGLTCVPHHHTGFDESARALVQTAQQCGGDVVLVGHPSGLSRGGAENVEHLRGLLRVLADGQSRGVLAVRTIAAAVRPVVQ